MKKVAIIMGSDSDLPIAQKAIDVLNEFNVGYEVHVYSAHRTPYEAMNFAKSLRENEFGACICFAGMAAHLAGAVAAQTTIPVIGVPCDSGRLSGLDALLSTVQMPSGIPVATVAINGGANSALLAIQMLSISDDKLAKALDDKRQSDKQVVLEKNKKVENNFNNK